MKTEQKPTVLSLFSGIGTIDLAFQNVGFEIIGQVENENFCNRVLQKHWRDVPRWGDIRTIKPEHLPKADIIVAGFPCQPFSYTGKQQGTKDERWLWAYIDTIIKHVKPKFIFFENVPGILTVSGGGAFREILRTLSRSGYDAEWTHLYASDAGAPHRRKRFVFVAHHRSQRVQRIIPTTIPRKPRFSGFQNVRGLEDLRSRPDIPEPVIRRDSDGFRDGVDRLRSLGNAVVPQVVEPIAYEIHKLLNIRA